MERFNLITLRKAKLVYSFGLSEYNRVKILIKGNYHYLLNLKAKEKRKLLLPVKF